MPKSKRECVYFAADNTYVIEAANRWQVGDTRYDGEIITRIEVYDYSKNYEEA